MSIFRQMHTVNVLEVQLGNMSAADRVAWAVQEYGAGLTFATSFGAEDMVVLDLLLLIHPAASVFTLDTGRLNQETYDLMELTRQRYGRNFTVYAPETAAVEELVNTQGPNLFFRSVSARKRCCQVRKVEPLSRALASATAWLTGLRREQGVTRAQLPVVEIDDAHRGIMKINPLADWTHEQVWAYLREHDLPYNRLHDRGYPSIGCAPCTRAIHRGEDIRAGRWWWEEPEHKECGLHLKP